MATCVYCGFLWDVQARTVCIPEQKRTKYLAADRHMLSDIQKLYGKLLHACTIIPYGRAFLTRLEAFLGISHDRPFLLRTAPTAPRRSRSQLRISDEFLYEILVTRQYVIADTVLL